MAAADLALVDIGVNLANGAFAADRDAVIARARAAGVTRLVVTGTDLEASAAARALCATRRGTLWFTAGVHPHQATQWTAASAAALRELLADPAAVAVGECGLDFFRNVSPPAAQERAFAAQLALARELGRPVFLHQRDAQARFVAMLREQPPQAGVAHCFTGGRADAEQCLELGLLIGVTGWICDERRGAALRAALPAVPLDRVLLETDAPYLLPRDLPVETRDAGRSRQRNEPRHLPQVARAAAACLGVDYATLVAATTANAERLFGLR